MSLPQIPEIVERLVKLHEGLGLEMSPSYGVLAMRCACPVEGCGYAEKHGRRNLYETGGGKVKIGFHCPEHGYWTIVPFEGGARNIEFNTPLRNLVRTVAYAEDTMQSRFSLARSRSTEFVDPSLSNSTVRNDKSKGEERQRLHMRVTGADYSGFYQEQLLWRQLPRLSSPSHPQSTNPNSTSALRSASSTPATNVKHANPSSIGFTSTSVPPPPVILYAPLITDWSSSKLSKSLYVRQHAYTYLKSEKKDYLLSWERMKELGRDEKVLFREVEKWVQSPERLFRNYSVEYLGSLFERERREKMGLKEMEMEMGRDEMKEKL
ncbi:hypothetical protein SISSUDRAFT_1048303 [Sistotremastrum suecicum HHB10207 ss-3]|uniref:Uncharacterized protein n=1 Tax=Sistotremastrum suecicum HHB10207 ss-3 TaxID=1314776 RepID=A0A166CKR9_9AGAM|nr:hypothetical protein SISSUDRAFT_1048303 [Sistotremastrum suecicum HHB10207 ss-3]